MERQLIAIEGNTQRLDGGSMFGNAPRALWERWATPDAQNRIPLACRALLVREPGRTLLFETGIGAFFEPKMRERFGVQEERHVLLDNLRTHGLTDADVDVVVLSHLHFDHAGGLLAPWEAGAAPRLLFPRATIVTSARHWDRARRPHARDRASFIPELPALLEASGRLSLCAETHSHVLGEGYRFHFSDGHTPGMMLTEIATPEGPVVFVADLAPGRAWVHLAITMGYDRYAELLIDEKRALFEDLVARDARLFFTHDPDVAMVRLTKDATGKFAGQ